MSIDPKASVVITTRNRKEDLCKAIESALGQTGVAVEVIVVDDGSTDGTSDLVAKRFPAVRLVRFDMSRGYIVQRNYG
jgi:succinoglycan biosynthesis protein ExoO